jgi:hypothetical protein
MAYEQDTFVLNLTNSFKDIIRQNGLIDTGALLASIRAFVKVSGSTLTIRLGAIDYFKYLVEPYRLIEQWTESSRFNQIINEIIEGIAEDQVNDLLQTGSYDPSKIPSDVEIDIFYY